jgi:hypothetical protein
MATTKEKLRILRDELQFLDKGGYRTPILWRSARIFEDSPTCPKGRWSACPDGDCVLLDFVPEQSRTEAIPCRYIPLNANGETLRSLYVTGTNMEIQETVREWLLKTIKELELRLQMEVPGSEKKAS